MAEQSTKTKEVKPESKKVEEVKPETAKAEEQRMPSQEEIINAMGEAIWQRDETIRKLEEQLNNMSQCSSDCCEAAPADLIDAYLSHQLAYQEEVMAEARSEIEAEIEKDRKYRYEHGDCCRPEPCRCDNGWERTYDEAKFKAIFLRELLRRHRNGL